ncbi:MAG: DUF255 domain-containing protein [Bacteroidota bacterium]|jgi:uncharacterized protein YyaL (SSP411 family)
MKKISIVLSVAIIILGLYAFKPKNDEVKWMNFNEGYALAKKKNKIILVDVYTEWCGWCKRMDKDTYAKTSISSVLNEKYVSVKFNPEVEGIKYTYNGKTYDGPGLAAAISNNSISGYPTTVFINTKTHKTKIEVGYKNESDMGIILVEIQKSLNSK